MSYLEKLSIIIPTRNRQEYVISTIKSILIIESDDFEVVVQDNSDDDKLGYIIQNEINDGRLKYYYIKDELSFSSNFEYAIKNSEGDYLIYIGDDDGIVSDIIEIVKWARYNNVECIKYSKNISYFWPNAFSNHDSISTGKLIVRHMIPRIKRIDCTKSIIKMLKKGDFDYQNYDFPQVYHGIIKRDVFDKVYKITGHYFSGLTPDIYSAVSLSTVISNIVYINYPFSFHGICRKSGSADAKTGRHTGELNNAPHFRGNNDYVWHSMIPNFYSVDTIWAETTFKAICDLKKDYLLYDFNQFNFVKQLLWKYPLFRERTYELYYSNKKPNLFTKTKLFILIQFEKIKKIIFRAAIFTYRIIIGRKVFYNVENMYKAKIIISNELNKKHRYKSFLEKLNKKIW